MNILVASDTHGRADLLQTAVERARPDLILFLGDGLRDLAALGTDTPTCAVRGNCDFFGLDDTPEQSTREIGRYRIFMTHGHRYGVKSSLESAIAAALAREADVLLYGHTHIPFEKTLPRGTAMGGTVSEKPLLVLCPGSLGNPHDGRPSFATLEIREGGLLAGFGHL